MSRRGRPVAALGIDVGTSETKAGVVTLDGRLLALARRRTGSDVDPALGRAEQDPETWWTGLLETAAEAVATAGADVIALAVDGHGPTLTPVDAAGVAVHPAITWQDTRSRSDAIYLADRTGLRGWALGILPAARWLERHDPAAASRARWYLNSWEALALRLTGRAGSFIVDDPPPLDLDRLRATGLAVERLAPRLAVGEILGPIHPELAKRLGLATGTPVVAGVVDAYASLHGARMLAAGDAIDVGGAAGGFGLYWEAPIQAQGSFTAPAPIPGKWLVGGAMAATGAALDWFRQGVMGGARSTAEIIADAASVPAGSEGVLFLPYLAGERSPLWDPLARGAFVGLTLRHGHAAMTRAILEASAYAVRHVAAGIRTAGGRVDAMRVCGGPARSDTWNHIKADVTGFPVEVPRILETAVVGSAIIAATGVGAQPDLETAIRAMATIERRLEPNAALAATYDRGFASYVALYPAIAEVLGRHPAAIESVP